jgi:rhomboid family GlyGly-CTERM serine protease
MLYLVVLQSDMNWMKLSKGVPAYLLGLAVLMCTVQWVAMQLGRAEAAEPALAWSRLALDAGAWWRLLSGSWVHLSWMHLALNLGGAGLVIAIFARWIKPLHQLLVLLLLGVFTGVMLWWLFPGVSWMVGLSGPLHGLFAWNAMMLTSLHDPDPHAPWWSGPRFGYVLLVGILAKVVFETLQGSLTASLPWLGGPVLIEAHQAGLLAGLVAGAVSRTLARVRCGC